MSTFTFTSTSAFALIAPDRASGKQQFAFDVFEALGLASRVVTYDPCRVYAARHVYTLVHDGRKLPGPHDIQRIREVLKTVGWRAGVGAGAGARARAGVGHAH